MPIVRLTVLHHGCQIPPEPLKDLLIREAAMSGSDTDAAIRGLMKGKSVDVSFDIGEDEAARAFTRNAEALGLDAKLQRDESLSWAGSRPRQWFLKVALAIVVGFGICVWLSVAWPNAIINHVLQVVEGLVIVCWLFSYTLADKTPKTQAQEDWESKLNTWWGMGLFALVVVIVAIVSEPMLGLVLLTLALGGIGFAFLIRTMNRH